jgi:hypothetical protein
MSEKTKKKIKKDSSSDERQWQSIPNLKWNFKLKEIFGGLDDSGEDIGKPTEIYMFAHEVDNYFIYKALDFLKIDVEPYIIYEKLQVTTTTETKDNDNEEEEEEEECNKSKMLKVIGEEKRKHLYRVTCFNDFGHYTNIMIIGFDRGHARIVYFGNSLIPLYCDDTNTKKFYHPVYTVTLKDKSMYLLLLYLFIYDDNNPFYWSLFLSHSLCI